MSGTTAARPSSLYASRQSGLRAFSNASSSFDFFGGTGGIGNGSTARWPVPSREISAARRRSVSRSTDGLVGPKSRRESGGGADLNGDGTASAGVRAGTSGLERSVGFDAGGSSFFGAELSTGVLGMEGATGGAGGAAAGASGTGGAGSGGAVTFGSYAGRSIGGGGASTGTFGTSMRERSTGGIGTVFISTGAIAGAGAGAGDAGGWIVARLTGGTGPVLSAVGATSGAGASAGSAGVWIFARSTGGTGTVFISIGAMAGVGASEGIAGDSIAGRSTGGVATRSGGGAGGAICGVGAISIARSEGAMRCIIGGIVVSRLSSMPGAAGSGGGDGATFGGATGLGAAGAYITGGGAGATGAGGAAAF